jgi:hypothetical protein
VLVDSSGVGGRGCLAVSALNLRLGNQTLRLLDNPFGQARHGVGCDRGAKSVKSVVCLAARKFRGEGAPDGKWGREKSSSGVHRCVADFSSRPPRFEALATGGVHGS